MRLRRVDAGNRNGQALIGHDLGKSFPIPTWQGREVRKDRVTHLPGGPAEDFYRLLDTIRY